jgi:hypothetical protein
VAFASSGVRVGVRATGPSIWEGLEERLPPDAIAAGSTVDHLFSVVSSGDSPDARQSVGDITHTLYHGLHPVVRTADRNIALDEIEARIRVQVATSSETRMFVHAGVVGWNGRAIVIPGVSHSGKSELVAALVRAGATYYSDEYSVLDEHGFVHPYARPIALRGADGASRERVTAESLGGAAGGPALPVGTIIVTRFAPGAAWRPRRLSKAESALALLAHAVRARLDPAGVLARSSQVALCADAFESPRGEASITAGQILQSKETTC